MILDNRNALMLVGGLALVILIATYYGAVHTSLSADEYNKKGFAAYQAKNYSAAIDHFKRSVKGYSKQHGKQHKFVAISLVNLGKAYFSNADYRQAQVVFEQANQIYQKDKTTGVMTRIENLTYLGAAYQAGQQPAQAIVHQKQALHLAQGAKSIKATTRAVTVAGIHHRLAKSYQSHGKKTKALFHAQQAVWIAKRVLGQAHADTQSYQKLLKSLQK